MFCHLGSFGGRQRAQSDLRIFLLVLGLFWNKNDNENMSRCNQISNRRTFWKKKLKKKKIQRFFSNSILIWNLNTPRHIFIIIFISKIQPRLQKCLFWKSWYLILPIFWPKSSLNIPRLIPHQQNVILKPRQAGNKNHYLGQCTFVFMVLCSKFAFWVNLHPTLWVLRVSGVSIVLSGS